MIDFDSINQGFSREAQIYDKSTEANPIIHWARMLVRRTITRYLPPESFILEINAGTGLDAAWLVEQGYRVHATDIADGMMAAIRAKIQASEKPNQFTAQQLSFTKLEKADHVPFDCVFSNFGGLNCVPNLSLVSSGLRKVLKPGGRLIWVIMPPICLWALTDVFRGRWHTAVKRLKSGGAIANISGSQVMTYYFTPKQVRQALGQDFEVESVQSFSLFCPPMYMERFSKRFPRLTKNLMWLDERLGHLPILNGCGDFFILTARFIKQ